MKETTISTSNNLSTSTELTVLGQLDLHLQTHDRGLIKKIRALRQGRSTPFINIILKNAEGNLLRRSGKITFPGQKLHGNGQLRDFHLNVELDMDNLQHEDAHTFIISIPKGFDFQKHLANIRFQITDFLEEKNGRSNGETPVNSRSQLVQTSDSTSEPGPGTFMLNILQPAQHLTMGSDSTSDPGTFTLSYSSNPDLMPNINILGLFLSQAGFSTGMDNNTASLANKKNSPDLSSRTGLVHGAPTNPPKPQLQIRLLVAMDLTKGG